MKRVSLKKIKKVSSLFLALTMLMSLLFTLGSTSAVATETDTKNVPTIFLNNDAWYKYYLSPPVVENGEVCIPISVYSGFDFLSVRFDEIYSCYIITDNDGNFLSINTQNCRYLTQSGETGDITAFQKDREFYVSAEKSSANIWGVECELAVFYSQNVVRLSSSNDLVSLNTLVKEHMSINDSLWGSPNIDNLLADKKDTVSFIIDATNLNYETTEVLFEELKKLGIAVTFAVNESFLNDERYLPYALKMAALGHTFAVKIDKKSSIDPLTQAEETNALILRLFKQKTLLVISDTDSESLSNNGYIVINNITKLDEIVYLSLINFKKDKTFYLDSFDDDSISKFKDLVKSTKYDNTTVVALNSLVGN
ncbi:MAG: hypothetical protein IKT56_03510 [Clostridia bacterium]|nr:hypothetical protein [Clostridia bacterium]